MLGPPKLRLLDQPIGRSLEERVPPDHSSRFLSLPRWSSREVEGVALFSHPCIGELSVDWNAYLGAWLMLYNCLEHPRGIVYRVAADPWGPWADAAVLF